MVDDNSGLGDPATLWAPQPSLAGEPAASQRWVWAAMEPAERRAKLRELAEWVAWLIDAHELHNTIPACWYQHSRLLERLTALYAGWVRVYCSPQSDRHPAEVDWITMLDNMEPRLKAPTCTSRHQPAPRTTDDIRVRGTAAAADTLEEFLLTSDWGTRPARHPAPREAHRLIATEPP